MISGVAKIAGVGYSFGYGLNTESKADYTPARKHGFFCIYNKSFPRFYAACKREYKTLTGNIVCLPFDKCLTTWRQFLANVLKHTSKETIMNIYTRKASSIAQFVAPYFLEHFLEDPYLLLKKLKKMIKTGFIEINEHVDAWGYKLTASMTFDDKYPLFEFHQEYNGDKSFKAFPFLEIVKEWVDA